MTLHRSSSASPLAGTPAGTPTALVTALGGVLVGLAAVGPEALRIVAGLIALIGPGLCLQRALLRRSIRSAPVLVVAMAVGLSLALFVALGLLYDGVGIDLDRTSFSLGIAVSLVVLAPAWLLWPDQPGIHASDEHDEGDDPLTHEGGPVGAVTRAQVQGWLGGAVVLALAIALAAVIA